MKLKKVNKWYALIGTKGYEEQGAGYMFAYDGIDLIVAKSSVYTSEWGITHAKSGIGFGLDCMDCKREGALERFLNKFPTEQGFSEFIGKAIDMKRVTERWGINPMYIKDETA